MLLMLKLGSGGRVEMAWNFEMVQILNQCLYINALLLPLAFKLEVHQGQASYTYDRMSSAHTKTKVRNLFCRTDTLREHYEYEYEYEYE